MSTTMNPEEADKKNGDGGEEASSVEEYAAAEPLPAEEDEAAAQKAADEEMGRVAAFLGNIPLLSNNGEQSDPNQNHGSSFTYAENPLKHSIGYILALDFWERFAFYGILFTLPGYLTGFYEPQWNPNFAPFEANRYIATSQAIGFISPFLAAVVADVLIGDYWAINFFTGLCYIPGVILIAVPAIPYASGRTDFPMEQLKLGTHILFPLGFGAAKTMYGVYAAKQYDPIHHADQIEKFFVIFTGVEFLGSFLGALISIVIADVLKEPNEAAEEADIMESYKGKGLIIAEFINVGAITLGLLIFLLGSPRYMKDRLMRKTYGEMFRSFFEAILCFGGNKGCAAPGFAKTKQSKGGRYNDGVVDGMIQILLLIPLFILIMPANVAFSQLIVVNITTTAFMRGFGPFKGPLLVATSLLFIGVWAFLVKRFLAPYLEKKQIKLSISDRFGLGSFFIGLAYCIAAILDWQNKRAYLENGSQVNIFWGLFGTFLAGGIVFLFAAMNEIAFTVAPTELKMLGTAIMIFMSQGLPNLIGSILFKACSSWFKDSEGNKIRTIEQFVDGKAANFTYLMIGMAFFNALLMMVPPVKRWISRVEEKSIANNAARAQGSTFVNVGDDDSN